MIGLSSLKVYARLKGLVWSYYFCFYNSHLSYFILGRLRGLEIKRSKVGSISVFYTVYTVYTVYSVQTLRRRENGKMQNESEPIREGEQQPVCRVWGWGARFGLYFSYVAFLLGSRDCLIKQGNT